MGVVETMNKQNFKIWQNSKMIFIKLKYINKFNVSYLKNILARAIWSRPRNTWPRKLYPKGALSFSLEFQARWKITTHSLHTLNDIVGPLMVHNISWIFRKSIESRDWNKWPITSSYNVWSHALEITPSRKFQWRGDSFY